MRRGATLQPAASEAEGQLPSVRPDKALSDIEIRKAAFGLHVVVVLWLIGTLETGGGINRLAQSVTGHESDPAGKTMLKPCHQSLVA